MIALVLDTNILHKSPYLTRDEWKSLSAHRDDWKVRLLVPEVVVMETINTVPREWDKQKNIFKTAKVGDFGLQEEVDAIVHAIEARIESYEDALKERLSELGAEVVPDPEVSHLKIAERASKGIAPYQGKATKDNYRDTLIWLTVIEVALKNPDHEVWFVSENHKDFGALDGEKASEQVPRALHQQLQKELASLGLQDQVKYVTDLASLQQHIAASYGPIATEELDALTTAIKFDVLCSLLNQQILAMTVPARDVALEPTVSLAQVNEILSPELEWKFSDEAKSGENDWTANYVVDVEAVVLGFTRDLEEMLSIDNKTLRASGTVRFTKQGVTQTFEVSRLEALPDDPNRRLWELLDKTGFGERGDVGSYLASQFRSGITVPPHIIDSFAKASGLASGITVPPHIMESLTKAGGLASGITVPPHIMESLTKAGGLASGITVPPHIMESLARAGELATADEEDLEEKVPDEKDPGQNSAGADS